MNPNRLSTTKPNFGTTFFALLAMIVTASAQTPVAITNSGFENPVLTDGNLSSGAIPGWSAFNDGTLAVLNPSSDADLTTEAPEGQNVGLITSSLNEDGMSQTLSAQFQADTPYTLAVKVANSKISGGFPGYRVQLAAGGTILAEEDNAQAVAEDAVITVTLNYTYNAGLHAGVVGQALEIRLLTKGLISGQEIGFDDIKLTLSLPNPVANSGGPYTVLNGTSLVLDGSGSLPSAGATITAYDWDLNNDDTFGDATGATPAAITYADLASIWGMGPGANTIKLRVTDSAAKTAVTTTTVTRQVDASLSSLVPSNGTLAPTFTNDTISYTASVPYATSSIAVTPTAANALATITVEGVAVTSGNPSGSIPLSVGANIITTVVTGEDSSTTKTYTITVTRETPSPDLSSLTITPATTLTPGFASGTTDYSATVPYATTGITVTPTLVDSTATITVDGNTVTSGSPSGTISLNEGSNTITTVVTAQDAVTKTYTLTVTRAALFTDGTWKTNADGTWSNAANWTSDAIANGSDFTATFGDIITANRAITLDAPFTIGNITATDTTHNYTISGANILTLDRTSGVPTIDVTTSGRALTISSEISGSDGLTKTSAGTLVLKRDSGSNTYTGTTTLSAGTLQGNTGTSLIASIANPFGTTALQLNGGTLQLRSDSAASGATATSIAWDNNTTVGGNATINVDRAGGSGSNKIHQLGTLSIGAFTLTAEDASSAQHDLKFGATTLTGNAVFNVKNNGGGSTFMNLTLGAVGESSPGYSLTKSGTGTLTLSAASTYSGGTVISGGTLTANADAYLGAAIGGITFSGNSTLAMTGTITHNRQITLDPGVTATIQSGAGITYNNSAKVTGAGNLKFTQTGNGGRTLRFNNTANDFTGTVQVDNTSGQALAVFFNSLVDSASSGAGNIIMNMSGANGPNTFGYGSTAVAPLTLTNRRLELNGTTGTVNAIFKNENTTQSVTLNSNLLISATGNKGLTLDSVAGPNNVFAGEIDNGSVSALTQVVSITKTGAGNWALSSAGNDFTGTINVNAGTLAYASAGGANPITFSNTTGSVTLSYTGSTDKTMSGAINAGSVTSGTVTLGSSGDGAVNYSNTGSLGTATSNTVRKLVLSGTNTGNNILAGQWVNNTGTSNAATLTKNGGGTWILSGTNTYTGATTISGGTLKLGANNVLADTTNLSIGTATLDADTFDDTVGTLDVTAAAVINLGTGANLAFADSDAISWTGGTLNVTGTLGATSLRFGTDNTGLTPIQLALISVNGSGAGTYILDGSGYLIPSGGGPGPLDHFAISAISSPQTVGTPITGITLTAQDASNATVSFTGTVTFGGTGGFTGTSGTFTAGVLSGISVTPTLAGSGLTLTVTDLGSGKTGTATFNIQTQYEAWAGGALFDADANGDGVKNGMAFLLGAASPTSTVPQPTATESGGALIMTFNCLPDAARGNATLRVEHSSDLGLLDPWTATINEVPDTTNAVPDNNVTFVVGAGPTGPPALNSVTVTIGSTAAASGKLFGRLNAQQ